jgi:hypothetical protein
VIASIGTSSAKVKSRTIEKTLNPAWNETLTLSNVMVADSLKLTVMDWDRVGSDDFLGEVTVAPLASVLAADSTAELWLPLGGAEATGQLHVMLHLSSKAGAPTLTPKLVAKDVGQLFVRVLSGKGLAAKDKSGASDPYCELAFADDAGDVRRTTIERKTLDPRWDDDVEFYFEVLKNNKELNIRVFDWNLISKDEPMGVATLKLADLPDGAEVERELKLRPQAAEKATGSLQVRASLISAERVAANNSIAADHYDELVQLLVSSPDTVIVASLCDVYQSDEVARVLVSIFEAQHQTHRLLNQLLFREIKRTEQAATLFRTDSMATKAVRNYLRLSAGPFVRAALGDGVAAARAGGAALELDPTKGGSPANAAKLVRACEVALASILETANSTSAARVPNSVRSMLGSLRLLVSQRFGDEVAGTAIGAVLFLRFICPAIAAPDAFQVVEGELTKDDRRACVLVSKVIQNLANGVRFGQKEAFMEPMNAFIDRQTPAYNAFIQEIAAPPKSQMNPSTVHQTQQDKVLDMAVLVRHLQNNLDRVKAQLPKDLRAVSAPERLAEAQKSLSRIAELLKKK